MTHDRVRTSVRRLARAAERRLTRRWTRPLPRPADDLLVMLSQAADHSVLWGVLVAGGASLGGARERRAAGHGVFAIAVASAAVNGPMKLFFRAAAAGLAAPASPHAAHFVVPITRTAVRNLRLDLSSVSGSFARPSVPSEAVLVTSAHAGRSRELARARRTLDRQRIDVAEELEIEHLDRLPELLRAADGEPRLVIAAGGDGTVGSVAGHLAGADNPLGILPLGTGNDFARSLDIPLNPSWAAPGRRGTSRTPRPWGSTWTSRSWPPVHPSAVASGASRTSRRRSTPYVRGPRLRAHCNMMALPTSWTSYSSR